MSYNFLLAKHLPCTFFAHAVSVSDALALSCSTPRGRPHLSPLMIPHVNIINIHGQNCEN